MLEVYHTVNSTIPLTQTCRACKLDKPINQFYKNKGTLSGHEHLCKSCAKIKTIQHYRKRHPNAKSREIVQYSLLFKVCCKCGQEKEITCFYKTSKGDGYRAECKKCKDKQTDEIHKRDPEKRKNDKKKQYHKDIDKSREQARRRRDKNREKHNAYARKQRQKNPEYSREYVQRRNALKKSLTASKVSYKKILERDGYYCHICGNEVMPNDVEYDHVIPLARGGPHMEDNIKVSHAKCNRRKRDKLLDEMTDYERYGIA